MTQCDSELYRRAVSQGADRLPTPTAREADLTLWIDALAAVTKPTGRDLELAKAALRYGTESRRLRERFDGQTLAGLGSRKATLLALAELNRTFHVLRNKTKGSLRRAVRAGAVSLDHIADLPVHSSDQGQAMAVADFGDSAVDATEWWLRRAVALGPNTAHSVDLAATSRLAMARFSVERGLASLWQQVLWEGWRLRHEGEMLIHGPRDYEAEVLRYAWHYRHTSLFSQPALLGMNDWKHSMSHEQRRQAALPRTVIGLEEKRGRRLQYLAGKPAIRAKEPDAFYLSTLCLERSYLSSFLDTDLPLVGVTVRRAHQAWHILNDLAARLSDRTGRNPFADGESLERWALAVKRQDAVDLLCRCLDLEMAQAESIIGFFTWTPDVYKGLWGAPLVALPNSDKVAMAHLPLANSNMMRWTEMLMKKGGLSDDLSSASRGRPFEAAVRASLRTAIANNRVLSDARCAEQALKRKGNGEEIDMIVQLGGLLLIGEVKCWLFPTEPVEYHNHRRKLEKAADQASRKAAWARQNAALVANHLGLTEERIRSLRIVPIVVQNQGFGTSLVFGDCPVIDSGFLELFFSSPRYASGGALSADGREMFDWTTLYTTEAEAVERFESLVRRPPVLERFKSRVSWRRISFPTSSGTPFVFEGADLDDASDSEKSTARTLQALIESERRTVSP